MTAGHAGVTGVQGNREAVRQLGPDLACPARQLQVPAEHAAKAAAPDMMRGTRRLASCSAAGASASNG